MISADQKKQFAKLTTFVTTVLASQSSLAENNLGQTSITLRHSNYSESNISEDQTLQGDGRRYDIKISQLNVFVPVNGEWLINFNHLTESMSGASPWYNQYDQNGEVIVAMSGATIFEKRNDDQIQIEKLNQGYSNRLLLGYSNEDDYQANYIKWGQKFEFDTKNKSFEYSIHFSDDKIQPTQHPNYNRVIEEEKQTAGFSIAFSTLINKTTVGDIGLFYTDNSGFLTDPYKQFDLNMPLDARPSERLQYGLEAGLSHHFPAYGLSSHFRYRYYQDDWQLSSHTFDSVFAYSLLDNWDISFSFRFYLQDEAEFYQTVVTDTSSGAFSSDYRLSSYGALSLSLESRLIISENYQLVLNIEDYNSKADWGLSSSQDAHPALVDFFVAGIEIEYRF